MRWILDKDDFQQVRLQARTCKYIDSGRYPTILQRWVFDDVALATPEFANLIQHLLVSSRDNCAAYVVLDPDPVHYFWREFNKYPALEIDTGDPPEVYLRALNEDPGSSPVDAVGTNWWECVIVPPSISWFIHCLRDDSDRGGHLWIPGAWKDEVVAIFPDLRLV